MFGFYYKLSFSRVCRLAVRPWRSRIICQTSEICMWNKILSRFTTSQNIVLQSVFCFWQAEHVFWSFSSSARPEIFCDVVKRSNILVKQIFNVWPAMLTHLASALFILICCFYRKAEMILSFVIAQFPFIEFHHCAYIISFLILKKFPKKSSLQSPD